MKRLLLVIIAATAIIIPADKKGAVKHKRVAKKSISKTVLRGAKKMKVGFVVSEIDFLNGSFFVLRFF